jgi:hypothetical protein
MGQACGDLRSLEAHQQGRGMLAAATCFIRPNEAPRGPAARFQLTLNVEIAPQPRWLEPKGTNGRQIKSCSRNRIIQRHWTSLRHSLFEKRLRGVWS